MNNPTPPTSPQNQTPAPAPGHSRWAIGATIFAATLSSIASLFVITTYMEKNKTVEPTPQTAKSVPAATERQDSDLQGAGNHEKLKELFGKLTPEQRERWKSMTPEQRREFRMKLDAELRAAKSKPQQP